MTPVNIKLVDIIEDLETRYKKIGTTQYVYNGVKISFVKTLQREKYMFNGHALYWSNGDIYYDMLTEKWFLESGMKFKDMTIEDLEVLKFYRECMK